jgi:hypothetical protein
MERKALQIMAAVLALYALPSNTTSAAREEPLDIEEMLRDSCAMLYPTDFRRQADCPDDQRDALRELLKGRPSDVTQDEYNVIVKTCMGRSAYDMNWRLRCMQDQYAGLRKLKKARGE